MSNQWRFIPNHPGYTICSDGRVKRGDKLLKPDFNPNNPKAYPRIRVRSVDGPRRIFVHVLVALTFIGPKPEGHQVNHKDGNRGNPSAENLEYLTPSENIKHSYRELGRNRNTGAKHGMAKLNDARVRDIHAMRQRGNSLKDTAAHFGIGVATVSMICSGATWQHLGLPALGDHRLKSVRVIEHPKTASVRHRGTSEPSSQL